MSGKDLHDSFNESNNALLERPETAKQKGKNIWIVCGAAVIYFCIWMLGIMAWGLQMKRTMLGGPSPMSST